MTFNFAMQAIDQVINSAGKSRYMSAGELNTSVVFRGPNGAAAGVAAQHSQCYGAWYSQVPGLKVLSPYDSEDCRGLMKAAIRDGNPVIFLENELMYGETFDVPDAVMDPDFLLPIGKAKIMREGKDVSIIAHSRAVGSALAAAETLAEAGISCEVLNLRSLRPLDRAAIIATVRKTGRLVTVEGGWAQSGIGAEVVSVVAEEGGWEMMEAPPVRVAGADIPTPYAAELEKVAFPGDDDVVKAVKKVMAGAM
mmetsp:Transcript_3561/g.9099  ORF Transcript_3561/g.9099 Transcript_3561/m.9099 type:complete len:252 (+) Transcript_3561:497-1252(+)